MKPIALGVFAVGLILVLNKEKILMLNSKYDEIFKREASRYGLDWQMMKRIAYIESRIGLYPSVAWGILNPTDLERSKSNDGKSWGIMQMRPSTARDFDPNATAQLLNDPEYSIMVAAQYINWCSIYLQRFISKNNRRFNEFLVKSYNQGVGNTVKEISGASKGFAGQYFEKYQAVA